MSSEERALGHVSLNGITVRLKLKKGLEEAEIPVDVQQTTVLQKYCSISAHPRCKFEVCVEFATSIDSQPDSRAYMVSIAYDARNDAQYPARMRTNSWLLNDVTKSRHFMSHRAIVYVLHHRRGIPCQRNMPGYTIAPQSATASGRMSRSLRSMKAHEGGISVYVHSVECKAPATDRKWIPKVKVRKLEGRQSLVAEFHFANRERSKSSEQAADASSKQFSKTPRAQPRPASDPNPNIDPKPDLQGPSSGRSILSMTRRAIESDHPAGLEQPHSGRSKPAAGQDKATTKPTSDNTTSKIFPLKKSIPKTSTAKRSTPKNSTMAKSTKHSAKPKAAFKKSAEGKQAYFEDDDQDDEEPLPPRPHFETKQEVTTEMVNQARNATVTEATRAWLSGASANEKAKKRARLSQELEEMEIEERQLEIKKRKMVLKRQLLQLDEED